MTIDINGFNPNRADGQKRQVSNKSPEPNTTSNANVSSEQNTDSPKVSVSLSSSAQNLAMIESELKSLPDVNQARVDEIKARIDRGEYQPDSENLAQKMLNLE
ncbi:MAG: flagellar biosynthesis anti-sigma factor FlgM [Oleiphilus sp.]